MGRCGDLRLIERQWHHFMAAQIADVADIDGQIIARLPLKVERFIHRIGQLVGAIINSKRKEWSAREDRIPVWQELRDVRGISCRRGPQSRAPWIRKRSAIRRVWVAGGNKALVVDANGGTLLRAHIGRSLINPKGSAWNYTRRESGREISKQLAAVVINSPAGANYDFAIKLLWTPGKADAGR